MQKKTLKILSLAFVILSMTSISLLAQESLTITGKITGAEGEPLPGANVLIKGANTGVVTNLYGNYSIDAKRGQVLEFSFISYIKQEVMIDNQTIIDN